LKPGPAEYFAWDRHVAGFGVRVQPSGAKSYVVKYRAGHGRSAPTRRVTLGAVGKMTADEARKAAKKLTGAVAQGRDPAKEQRTEAATTLKNIAERYFDRESANVRTMALRRATFERLIFPRFGNRQIDSIRRSEISALLDRIATERGAAMADQVLAYLRRFFSWHAANSDDFRSPIVRGMARTKPSERRRKRILSDDEIRAVWTGANATPGPFGAFVQFLLVTAARRTEAARMTRSELAAGDWVIPEWRYKTGLELVVPLSAPALSIVARLPSIGPRDFVFTSDGQRPLGGFSKAKRKFDQACGVTGWTLHDLRRTARSLMSRAGVPSDHAERALGHVLPGVRGTYDRHAYRDEKRRAFEALAGQLDLILNLRENVVRLTR
jgi:integrase